PHMFRPAVIVPTYNNAPMLGSVLEELVALKLPLFVVNDGATDATAQLLEAWRGRANVHVLTHERNRGKAAALRTGFAAANERSFTHAVTFDSDGQLNS